MKKKLISLLLVLVMPMLVLCGCNREKAESFELVKEDRFTTVRQYQQDIGNYSYTIIADKETRVMYVIYRYQSSRGITALLNPDGTPMLYEGEL